MKKLLEEETFIPCTKNVAILSLSQPCSAPRPQETPLLILTFVNLCSLHQISSNEQQPRSAVPFVCPADPPHDV